MHLDYSDEETDRLLAAVDVADIAESPPAPTPELLGVVQETPIDQATTSAQAMSNFSHTEVFSARSFSTTHFSTVRLHTARFFAGGPSVDDDNDSRLLAHACPDIATVQY